MTARWCSTTRANAQVNEPPALTAPEHPFERGSGGGLPDPARIRVAPGRGRIENGAGMTQAPAPLGTRATPPYGLREPRTSAHLYLELRGFAGLIETGATAEAAAVLLRFNRLVADASAEFP